ncbi:MAG: MgtC/SapB family protein, partial [Alphaproteobacteria bacterium]|nr:MgtC/SapB family protein [Alphaproteobacteria bacterium]
MTDLYLNIAAALAIGLLVGLERGWSQREKEEGGRIAGIRTFAVTGLLGGVIALLSETYGNAIVAVALGAVALFVGGSLVLSALRDESRDRGITTDIALLLTFVLGLLAGMGELEIAAASAVVLTILLGLKPQLHHWLQGLDRNELFAFLKLLLMSVVILPVLPDRGFGPW